MPGAARPAAALDPDERLEDALPVLDRDARTVVGHVDLDLVAEPPHADAHAVVADGAYFDSFSSSCSRTWRKRASSPMAIERAVGPLPADRVRPEQQAQRLDGLVDRLDGVERGTRQAGQALAADRRQDRIHEPVEPRELVVGGVAPGRGGVRPSRRPRPPPPAGRRRPGRPTAGVRSSWVTTLSSSARAASRAVSSTSRASTSAVSRPFSTMPGEQRGDRRQEVDLVGP